ncbi:MAG: ribonuclease HIII [candidate division Zixibacteria bacterium]|nr:ribonuclease HIII [candidate division Zixibacteria bacterium]
MSRQVIGVDESGKGDFFGPLVIASFYASDAELEGLTRLGVRDSKLISDNKLIQIDARLRTAYPHALVIIGPERYNQLYDRIKNLNRLLAWGHARAIENILDKHPADLAISDKFGNSALIENALMEKGRTIRLEQLVRGESILQVAAASILARAAFLREMKKLSDFYRVTLPRGASAGVDRIGAHLVNQYGPAVLDKIAKRHFKNYQRAVNPTLFK